MVSRNGHLEEELPGRGRACRKVLRRRWWCGKLKEGKGGGECWERRTGGKCGWKGTWGPNPIDFVVRYRVSLHDGTWDFSWDAVAGKGLILRWRENHVVLLKMRRDSRVMTGNLGFLLLALKSNLPFGLRGGAGDCARVTAGQKSPGEVNDNPLAYAYQRNLVDRAAWGALVRGVATSRTQLTTAQQHYKGEQ